MDRAPVHSMWRVSRAARKESGEDEFDDDDTVVIPSSAVTIYVWIKFLRDLASGDIPEGNPSQCQLRPLKYECSKREWI